VTEADFRLFLQRWVDWVFDQSLHGLGYSQCSYAERVGVSTSTSDPLRDWEPEILQWDEFYRTVLPPTVKEPLRLCYLVPGPEKRKYGNKSSRDYYQVLLFARETARLMFNRHMEKKEAA